jgi:hypothetical protein
MKSFDLINWTHSDFRVDKAFAEFSDIGCRRTLEGGHQTGLKLKTK